MKPGQQLHRSLTFWAGLLIILFTCWAWRDSISNTSVILWKQACVGTATGGTYAIKVPRRSAALQFNRMATNTEVIHRTFEAPFLVHYRESPGAFPEGSVEVHLQWSVNLSGPGSWALFLPYWLIVLTLALTWIALLLTRAQRRKRSATHAPS